MSRLPSYIIRYVLHLSFYQKGEIVLVDAGLKEQQCAEGGLDSRGKRPRRNMPDFKIGGGGRRSGQITSKRGTCGWEGERIGPIG